MVRFIRPFLLLLLTFPILGFSEEMVTPEGSPPIIVKVAAVAILALLPFIIMLMTSFLKMVIVFSLLRNAIGVQQSPPNQAINGMALLMSIYVMFPTGVAMYDKAKEYIQTTSPQELFSADSAFYVVNVIDKAKDPLKDFLKRNTAAKNSRYFFQLAYKKFPEGYREKLSPDDFVILVPAYITSQIKAAFEVGVLIYLPFFVIDLVTSNILLAMGMMMLSPLTIALPLKLLLIVMIDGWTLIVQGLVLSFR
jgi:type III secretion protein R